MTDTDRLMAHAERPLEDGCGSCGYSLVYCHCVTYIDARPCCDSCSHPHA